MSIARLIANFIHRAKDGVEATEEELKVVIAAVEPEVVKIKNAAVDEVKDGLGAVLSDVKDALELVSHDHGAALDAAQKALTTAFGDAVAEVHARFDVIEKKLAELRAANAEKTSPVKSAAKKAAAPAPAPAPEVSILRTRLQRWQWP